MNTFYIFQAIVCNNEYNAMLVIECWTSFKYVSHLLLIDTHVKIFTISTYQYFTESEKP